MEKKSGENKQLGSVCQKIKTFKWLSDVLAHSHGCAASTNGRLEAWHFKKLEGLSEILVLWTVGQPEIASAAILLLDKFVQQIS